MHLLRGILGTAVVVPVAGTTVAPAAPVTGACDPLDPRACLLPFLQMAFGDHRRP
jgi:hypothetical protein